MDMQRKILLATQLQNNPLLAEILRDCKQSAFDRWRVSPEIQAREMCWLQYQSFETFEAQLAATLANILSDAKLEKPINE